MSTTAVALSEHFYGTEAAFVEQMNLRAQGLGLTGTYFADASGLPVPEGKKLGLTTTPRDVAAMTRVAPARATGEPADPHVITRG